MEFSILGNDKISLAQNIFRNTNLGFFFFFEGTRLFITIFEIEIN